MGMFKDFFRAIFQRRARLTTAVHPESNVLVLSPLTIAGDDPLKASTTYNFVIKTDKPFTKTKLIFNRIVLEGGKQFA
jgi:hypothetical protein